MKQNCFDNELSSLKPLISIALNYSNNKLIHANNGILKLEPILEAIPDRVRIIRALNGKRAILFGGETRLRCDMYEGASYTEALTLESWMYFEEMPKESQTIAEMSSKKLVNWQLGLDDHLRLGFVWHDEYGKEGWILSPLPLVNEISVGNWYHVAVCFFNTPLYRTNSSGYLEQDSKYARVYLYFTPYDLEFPRLLAIQKSEKAAELPSMAANPASLYIGSNRDGSSGFRGALADFVFTNKAKNRNEFPALGQHPPRTVKITSDFPLGSHFMPLETSDGKIVIGLPPFKYLGGSYWLYCRLDHCKNKKISCEILPVPGGEGMLNSIWLSYDNMNWSRLKGHLVNAQQNPEGGFFAFEHKFLKNTVWLASSIPYTIQHIEKLEHDFQDSPLVEILEISRTVKGRPIKLFKIENHEERNTGKHTFYMQAGQHSPLEMLAGHSMDKAIRYLAADGRELLRRNTFLFVPIVNIDAAYSGSPGFNSNAVNLNREWENPKEPEIIGMKTFIKEFIKKGNSINFAIDFHAGGFPAHEICLPIKASCSPDIYSVIDRVSRRLDADTDISLKDSCIYSAAQMQKEMFVISCLKELNIPAITIELSPMTYRSIKDGYYRPVDQAHINRLGIQIAKSLDATKL